MRFRRAFRSRTSERRVRSRAPPSRWRCRPHWTYPAALPTRYCSVGTAEYAAPNGWLRHANSIRLFSRAHARLKARRAVNGLPPARSGPTLNPHFWHFGGRKGAVFTPTKTPTFGYFGAWAGKFAPHRDQPTEGKRGAEIFHPFPCENGKNFSLQLIFQQIAWVGASALVENRTLRAIFAIFSTFCPILGRFLAV